MTKKSFDHIASIALLIVFCPLMLLIAILVKTTSKGPVIFKQKRVGRHEKVFIIYKFRTMRDGSGKPFEIVRKEDPRITGMGRLLRSTHLDELPQFWNVLKGDMSLVGPRPISEKTFGPLRELKLSGFQDRFKVKPGITGPLQLLGRKWILSNPRAAFLLDAIYTKNCCFREDLRILFSTTIAVIQHQGE